MILHRPCGLGVLDRGGEDGAGVGGGVQVELQAVTVHYLLQLFHDLGAGKVGQGDSQLVLRGETLHVAVLVAHHAAVGVLVQQAGPLQGTQGVLSATLAAADPDVDLVYRRAHHGPVRGGEGCVDLGDGDLDPPEVVAEAQGLAGCGVFLGELPGDVDRLPGVGQGWTAGGQRPVDRVVRQQGAQDRRAGAVLVRLGGRAAQPAAVDVVRRLLARPDAGAFVQFPAAQAADQARGTGDAELVAAGDGARLALALFAGGVPADDSVRATVDVAAAGRAPGRFRPGRDRLTGVGCGGSLYTPIA